VPFFFFFLNSAESHIKNKTRGESGRQSGRGGAHAPSLVLRTVRPVSPDPHPPLTPCPPKPAEPAAVSALPRAPPAPRTPHAKASLLPGAAPAPPAPKHEGFVRTHGIRPPARGEEGPPSPQVLSAENTRNARERMHSVIVSPAANCKRSWGPRSLCRCCASGAAHAKPAAAAAADVLARYR